MRYQFIDFYPIRSDTAGATASAHAARNLIP
jgi:hypothetical protein